MIKSVLMGVVAISLLPAAVGQTQSFKQKDTVILRALDKITGRSTDFEMEVGSPKVYGSLRVDLEVCFQTPPEEAPESAAFLKVTSATSKQVQTMAVPRDLNEDELAATEGEAPDVRFSGWMFASSPGLSALEHPVYDIWVIACSAVDPDIELPGPEETVVEPSPEDEVVEDALPPVGE